MGPGSETEKRTGKTWSPKFMDELEKEQISPTPSMMVVMVAVKSMAQ